MCGIWGYLRLANGHILKNMHKYFSRIKARGPDRSRFLELEKNNVVLGFHRLAIMDKYTNGDQPFVLESTEENRSIYCLVNGEIYNYKQLIEQFNLQVRSKSDCEVIPLLYEKSGINCVIDNIRGEFAVTIFDICHDANTVDVYMFRDPFGVRPLYYQLDDDLLLFSSEMKGLVGLWNKSCINHFPPGKLLHISFKTDVVTKAWSTYFDIDSFHPQFVEELDATSVKTVDTLEFVQKPYVSDVLKTVNKLLRSSVVSMLDTDRPLGALLSGGLDSSLVVGIAAEHLRTTGKKLRTFSVGIPGSTDKKYAEMVAVHCDTDHTHVEFTNEEFLNTVPEVIQAIESYDTTTVRASTGQYLISKWISQNTDIKVLLIGDGSDELTAGYMYFHNAPSSTELHYENCRLLKEIHMFDVLRADRGIASNGLEARVPYLNVDFVSMYLNIDPRLRGAINGHEKWLLRQAFNNDSLIPQQVLWRQKEAFSDGVSGQDKSWYMILQENVNVIITDEQFHECINEINKHPHYIKPVSKEALCYRQMFVDMFGENTLHVLKHYWLPKWCGNVVEPSARVLNVYNEIHKMRELQAVSD